MPTRSSDLGFTLIEVLIAVLIVSLVFGLLLESVTHNLADLSRSRAESRASQLAVDRLLELRQSVEAGEKLEDGVKEGAFVEPDQDMRWQISITPQTLALPDDYKGELSPSPIFRKSGDPPYVADNGSEPPLRLIQVRVYAEGTDPETVDPLVVLVASPPNNERLKALQQPSPVQNRPGQPGTQGQKKPGTGM